MNDTKHPIDIPPVSTHPIIGIGASAGGLEALRGLFKAIPGNLGAGFVLVQHLDPTHDSMMAELLTKYAQIPVVQVKDGMRVEPNRLHVIPPNSEMTISKGILHLTPPTMRRGLRMPIDRFFSSLADDQQEHAIAIVLSGTGTDGTYGVRMVKARGGMVLAQDLTTAGYDGMPRSAVATGDVDYVLPVGEMPEVLVRYIEHNRKHGGNVEGDKQDQDYMDNILALLVARQDHDFRCYKRGTINRRVLRRMGLNHISTLRDYHEKLRHDQAEAQALAKDLLIGVTSFFREPEAWQLLRDKVLAKLFATHRKDEVIRAWVPGCATGEEAYSLAMVLTEAAEQSGRSNNIIVFATDVDLEALEVARNGVYAESLVADIDTDRLERFFTRQGDSYLIKKRLREKVVFAPQNLITDPPFSKLSLISCRNLLIYIEPEYQERLLGLFHFSLKEGGYLFLGSSETVGQGLRLFDAVSKKWRIYRRVDTAVSPSLEFPIGTQRRHDILVPELPNRRRRVGFGPLAHKVLIEQFAPASVLVDREYHVLYYHGSVRDFIGPAQGDPSNDLLMLAGEGLRGKLRTGLHLAIAEEQRVEINGAHVRRGEQWYSVRIVIVPLRDTAEPRGMFLISFEDEGKTHLTEREGREHEFDEESVVNQLEEELKNTREELRSTIEQMETSNEELKASNEEIMSMNEELQSTNEELETSKEELQSLNEELITLNSQLEDKVHELEETTNDLSNLLVSTDIATVFLDRRFRIRRYTPAIASLMRLIPSDIGRAVTDITWNFQDSELLDGARRVLIGERAQQHEVQDEEGRWHLRRILPYRTEDEEVEGVVITFTDITRRKKIEVALQQSEATLRRITDSLPVLISYIDKDLCYRFNNAAYHRWFDIGEESLIDRKLPELLGEEAYAKIRGYVDLALEGNRVEYEDWVHYSRGGSRYISALYIPDVNDAGEVEGFFALVTDMTEKRKIEEQIAALNTVNKRNLDEMTALLDATPVGIFLGRDKSCSDMLMNRAGAEMLRIPMGSNPSMTGPNAQQLNFRVFHAGREMRPEELPMQQAAIQAKPIKGFEERVEFPDGSSLDLLTYAAPLFDENGEVRGCVGTFADVTEKKRIERRYRETYERLRVHIENAPLAVVEWNRDQVIVNWSGSAESILGWSADEAVNRSIPDLGMVYEDDLPQVSEVIANLLEGRAETNHFQNRNYRKDGSVIWCEWFNSVIRDENGEFLTALSMGLDVTERKRLEETIGERNRRLEQEDRRKDEFLAMLGHELRNPLTPIRNAVEMLGMQADTNPDVNWAAQLIDRQTRHLEHMVDDLLDMARIRKGRLKIEMQPLVLQRIIRETISSIQPSIDEHGHRLIVDMQDQALTVMGDATRLVQVFSNLLNNAVRYTPNGGTIRLSVMQSPLGEAQVDLEDNGNGISPKLLNQVFEIFNQAEPLPERSNAGLGLGLSLVKQIVRLHGGAVKAESEGLGKGSRFTVCLPLDEEETAVTKQPSEAEEVIEPTAEVLDILLVDDNADVRESLQRLLEALGHRVRGLDTGRKVLPGIQENTPDLVLLDIGMPDMDGFQVARQLAKAPQRNRFNLVAVTGYAGDVQQIGVAEEIFDGYLLKPLTLEMLRPYLCKVDGACISRFTDDLSG